MKARALINFSGIVTMCKGEELEIKDKNICKDLLNARYIEEVKKKKVKANED